MAKYKKYCSNPECGKIFETNNPRQIYCNLACRDANRIIRHRKKNKKIKVLKKCSWCGTFNLKRKGEAGYCNEEHKKNYEQHIKQKAICKKCEYWDGYERMCDYAFRTKKSRGFNDFPCKKLKQRGSI